jgi:hypothetical protein
LSARRNQLNYREALAKDLPIGSGEIESAHRYIAQQRLTEAPRSLVAHGSRRLHALAPHHPQKRRLARLLGRAQQEWANRRTLEHTLYGATNLTSLA